MWEGVVIDVGGVNSHPKLCRVAKAVSLWIRTAGAELVKDQVFLKLLKALQDHMSADKLETGIRVLTEALSESMRRPAASSMGSSLPSKVSHTSTVTPPPT